MKIALIVLAAAAIVIAMLIGWVISLYNGLVVLRNRFKNAFAQIDVQLRRRYDLIPNLVETAKGYLAHERETLTAVIEARNVAAGAAKALAGAPGDPTAMKAFASAEAGLAGVLSKLMMVAERYPELKADGNFLHLQQSLSALEDDLQMARRYYNGTVRDQNNRILQFPGNLVAGWFGFEKLEYFELSDEAEGKTPPLYSDL